MVSCETYLIVFDDPLTALRFVERLRMSVDNVSWYRDGCEVRVFDAGDQRERIMRLAQSSSATMARVE
jgi:hypothetical protein